MTQETKALLAPHMRRDGERKLTAARDYLMLAAEDLSGLEGPGYMDLHQQLVDLHEKLTTAHNTLLHLAPPTGIWTP